MRYTPENILNTFKSTFFLTDDTDKCSEQLLSGVKQGIEYLLNTKRTINQDTILNVNSCMENRYPYDIIKGKSFRLHNHTTNDFVLEPFDFSLIDLGINSLIHAVNEDLSMSPYERAAMVQGAISYIRPFESQNERTGRLIACKILMDNDCRVKNHNIYLYRKALSKNHQALLKLEDFEDLFAKENYSDLVKILCD